MTRWRVLGVIGRVVLLTVPVESPQVLRLDLGVRIVLRSADGYFLSSTNQGGKCVRFVFGFNY